VKVRASFRVSDRTYGARWDWRDLLAEGLSCGLHRIERLMRLQALKALPRRRRLPNRAPSVTLRALAGKELDLFCNSAADDIILVKELPLSGAARMCGDTNPVPWRRLASSGATLQSRKTLESGQLPFGLEAIADLIAVLQPIRILNNYPPSADTRFPADHIEFDDLFGHVTRS
jgi:hypothetical protein